MGWEVWVFPVNNTDRDKDHTGHRDTQAETPWTQESGHRQGAQFIGMPSRFRTPEQGASPACKRGPKGGQNHRYEGAKQFEKQKTSGAHSKDSSTVGKTLKINIFICGFERLSLQHEVEKEGRDSMDLGVGTMRRGGQPPVPVLTSASSRFIIACGETQRNIRNLCHQAGSTVIGNIQATDVYKAVYNPKNWNQIGGKGLLFLMLNATCQ